MAEWKSYQPLKKKKMSVQLVQQSLLLVVCNQVHAEHDFHQSEGMYDQPVTLKDGMKTNHFGAWPRATRRLYVLSAFPRRAENRLRREFCVA